MPDRELYLAACLAAQANWRHHSYCQGGAISLYASRRDRRQTKSRPEWPERRHLWADMCSNLSPFIKLRLWCRSDGVFVPAVSSAFDSYANAKALRSWGAILKNSGGLLKARETTHWIAGANSFQESWSWRWEFSAGSDRSAEVRRGLCCTLYISVIFTLYI